MNRPLAILVRNAAASDFGGGERLPIFIAKGLDDLGYETLTISHSKKLLRFAAESGVTHKTGWWWSYQNWSGWRVILTPLYVIWQLILFVWYLQLFIRLRPTVVHLQSKDDFIAGTYAARVCGARVVWSDYADLKHVWKNVRVWYKNPTGKLVYWAARFAHHIAIVSETEKQFIVAHLSPSSPALKRMVVVYIGVFDQLTDINAAARDETKVVFCAASRIVTDKGIGELLAAFTELHKTHTDSELWILGDGPEMEKFKTDTHGVTFFGHVSNPLSSIKAADVFILPTYHEAFSVALVEATMLGKAIIATRVGGNVEIIKDRETGLLVNVKDSQSLLVAMRELADNRTLRDTLGSNARKQYENKFTFDVMIKDGLIPLYEKNNH